MFFILPPPENGEYEGNDEQDQEDKKGIRAIPAAAMPVKPKSAAMIAAAKE
ncbi:MAG: hypothetical protein ACOC2Q_01085 [Spirochaetota bacterium]